MSNQSKLNSAAYDQLNKDADRILHLIKVQMDNLTLPSCPLYEEVLDTQMFGLQKEVDFAVQFVINCKNNVFTKLTVCIMYYV